MKKDRKLAMIWRWSFLSGGVIALFWVIWWLSTGEMPVCQNIKMTPNWTITLPWAIPRIWDYLLGPVFSIILILISTSEKVREDQDLSFGLGAGLAVGLGVGLGIGLVVGLGIGLVAGLGIWLAVGLVVIVIKTFFSSTLWRSFGRYMMAVDKEKS